MTGSPDAEMAIQIIRSAKYPRPVREVIFSLCGAGFEPALVEDAIFSMLNLEILRITEPSSDFESALVTLGQSGGLLEVACRKFFAAGRTTEKEKRQSVDFPPKRVSAAEMPEGLCATLPLNRIRTLSGRRPPSLLHGIGALVAEAQSTLDIASPFLDVQGISSLEAHFKKAAFANVHMRVLTRIENMEEPDPRLVQGLFKLSRLFESKFEAANLAYLSRNPVTGYANLKSALHAKLVVCDHKVAYVGSADLRYTALHSNLEAGLILRDKTQVQAVSDLFETGWSDGEPIEVNYIEQKAGI